MCTDTLFKCLYVAEIFSKQASDFGTPEYYRKTNMKTAVAIQALYLGYNVLMVGILFYSLIQYLIKIFFLLIFSVDNCLPYILIHKSRISSRIKHVYTLQISKISCKQNDVVFNDHSSF